MATLVPEQVLQNEPMRQGGSQWSGAEKKREGLRRQRGANPNQGIVGVDGSQGLRVLVQEVLPQQVGQQIHGLLRGVEPAGGARKGGGMGRRTEEEQAHGLRKGTEGTRTGTKYTHQERAEPRAKKHKNTLTHREM